MRLSSHLEVFSRFKIVSELFLSLSPFLSLSLFPDELVFAPVHRREYSLISDIHSSPLTDGVITSSAGISAIGHDQSVRFSPRKGKKKRKIIIAWLLLTLLINFPSRRIFVILNGDERDPGSLEWFGEGEGKDRGEGRDREWYYIILFDPLSNVESIDWSSWANVWGKWNVYFVKFSFAIDVCHL